MDRISARAHLAVGLIVAGSGAASAVFVVMVNAWMNTPHGRADVGRNGRADRSDRRHAEPVDPATGVAHVARVVRCDRDRVAGIHAAVLLRRPSHTFHRYALSLALAVGVPAAILQPLSGDLSARTVARWQPVKLAALEGQFETQKGAPLRIGGWPDAGAGATRFALEIPRGLSLLAFHDPNAEVQGLDAFDRDLWPPLPPVHVAFYRSACQRSWPVSWSSH